MVVGASAQDAGPVGEGLGAADKVTPKEPLVKVFGSRMEYEVEHFYFPGADWERSPKWRSARAAAMEVDLMGYSIDAANGVAKITKKWGNGSLYTEWFMKGVYVAPRSTGGGYYIVGPGRAPGLRFPELSWINMNNYKGVAKFDGRPVFVFRDRNEEAAAEPAEDQAADPSIDQGAAGTGDTAKKIRVVRMMVAYLDGLSQVPILFSDGEVIRLYRIKPTPAVPLAVPADLLNMLKTYQADALDRVALPADPAG